MIWLDPRAGSVELAGPLLAAGLPVVRTTLAAGDVEISGRGPGGRPLAVGVEYKKVRDLLTCVRDGRFAEQARRMRSRYEVSWLLVEGEWTATDRGLMAVRERKGFKERGKFTVQEVTAWLLTMVQRGGVLLWRTHTQEESVEWLRGLYWWWTSKDFEAHRAHLDWYTPPYVPENPLDVTPPSMVQKVAAALLSTGPTVDVGGERARAAAAYFKSVTEMLAADVKTWRAIDGIGPTIARRVVEGLR